MPEAAPPAAPADPQYMTKADYEAWGQKMETWFSESIRESLDQVSKKDWALVADLPDPGPEPDVNPEGVERQFLHSSSLGA